MQQMITSPIKPEVTLLYNGNDCTKDFSRYLNQVTYREFEDNESDELSLILNDTDGYFTDLWYPEKGAKLSCNIIYGTDIFDCGNFTIDENSYSYSISGDILEIRAQTAPKTKSIKTRKTVNHTGKTLVNIAQEIGDKQSFKVVGTQGFVNVGTVIQKNETDLAFLKRISDEYGYTFNIKDGLLTFTLKSDLWNSESVFTLDKTQIRNLRLKDSLAKVYGKIKAQYLDLKTNKIMTYTASANNDVTEERTLYKRFASLEEAKVAADAALKNSSSEISGNIELKKPNNSFLSGVNFDLTSIGKFEGQYHIKSTQRTISPQGYSISGEIIKC